MIPRAAMEWVPVTQPPKKQLGRRAQIILGWFRLWAERGSIIQPRISTLARNLDVCLRTAKSDMKELYEAGLVKCVQRYRRPALFFVLEPVCTANCTAIEKPYKRIQRLQEYTPLVIFRDVCSHLRWRAKKKPIAKPWRGPQEKPGFYAWCCAGGRELVEKIGIERAILPC